MITKGYKIILNSNLTTDEMNILLMDAQPSSPYYVQIDKEGYLYLEVEREESD